MTETILGGWSTFDFNLSDESKNVLKKATDGLGVNYTPVAVATQVVAGLNYCFICEGQVVYPGTPENAYKVYIHAPLHGDPQLTAIERILP